MKKTLLLSVVASTMIMAGGDIAPVEPVVEAPAAVPAAVPLAKASGWDFNGEGVVYYQTMDNSGATSLFDQASSAANVGIRAAGVNKNLFAGIGAGFELVGLGTLGLEKDVVSSVLQFGEAGVLQSGAITQAYLTYGFGNTAIKVGRQILPKGLSPFAFSETWNVFQNTFEAALVVNTDIANTTLVYAYVDGANSHAGLGNFEDVNPEGNGVHLVTVQNTSIDALTLTGSWYNVPDFLVVEDLNILWGDAQYAASGFTYGIQGGTVLTGEPGAVVDTTAFGAKIGATFGMFNVDAAYTTVNDGTVGIANLAGGTPFSETPLYTGMLANVLYTANDNNTFVLRAGANVLGGTFGVAYGLTSDNSDAANDYTEIDVTYSTKISENTSILAAYIYADEDKDGLDANNVLRFWARYNF